MATKIYIVAHDDPLYVSSCDTLGFVFGPTPHSLIRFNDGELRISFSDYEPLYVYEDWGMLFVSDRPLNNSGPVLATHIPVRQAV